MSSPKSKSNFITFLAQDWQRQSLRTKLYNKVMYVTCERKCFRVTKDTSSEVESLYSTQEEADTRMFLHAKHEEEESTAIIIASQDTGVFIMSLSFAREFACQVYIKGGTQTREKFVDVQKVAAAVGQNTCCAIPGLHSFTDCDTVRAFGGKGKISAFKLMQKNRKYQDAITQLGKEWSVPGDLFNVLQEFTCTLYAARCPNATVNELRYQLFRAKKGEVESDSFLLVKIASSCTVFGETTRLECGAVLLKSVPVSPTQVVRGGVMKMGSL